MRGEFFIRAIPGTVGLLKLKLLAREDLIDRVLRRGLFICETARGQHASEQRRGPRLHEASPIEHEILRSNLTGGYGSLGLDQHACPRFPNRWDRRLNVADANSEPVAGEPDQP